MTNFGYRQWDYDAAKPAKPEGEFTFDDLDDAGAVPSGRFSGKTVTFDDLDEQADANEGPGGDAGGGGRPGKTVAAVIGAGLALLGFGAGYAAATAVNGRTDTPPAETETVTVTEGAGELTGVPPVSGDPGRVAPAEPEPAPQAPSAAEDGQPDAGPAIGNPQADTVVGDNAVDQ